MMPAVITSICTNSVQVTAAIPPPAVYATTSAPITSVVHWLGQPRITVSTTAGADSATPTASPRDSRNIAPASARVFASKRFSRYSYAVKTPDEWNRGTANAEIRIIASGSPRYICTNRMPSV